MIISILLQVTASASLGNAFAGLQSLLFQVLIYGIIPIFMIFATILRYSIKYFQEKQQKFTFKFIGEQWWLIYEIMRYISMVAVVLIGLVLFWPGLYLNTSVVVPFQPLGFDLFALAFLLLTLNSNRENDKLYNTINRLTLSGTAIYLIGTIIFIVCPQQLPLSQGAIYNVFSQAWMQATNTINSQANMPLTIFSIYINIAFIIIYIVMIAHPEYIGKALKIF